MAGAEAGTGAFFDTNVLLYLLSADAGKADRAEELLVAGGTVSVQVLNEFASVALRKLGMSHGEVREALDAIRTVCQVMPLTLETHDKALRVAERYGYSFYDALILGAAQLAGCRRVYSEDMHAEQVIDGELAIVNPFAS
jgi:predicted nucleic acid-binding protein